MKTMCVFICSVLFIPFLFGQVPRTISYQGVLTDNAGNPKPDGSYTIAFSFYESSTGGEAIWNEIKTLNISKGLFSTSLGDQVIFSANVKFDKPYWLGIKVGNEAELSPRIALTSSGYSFSSNTAFDVVDGKVVKSLNNLKDNITIMGSGGTTINTNGDTISISSSGTGGTGIQGIQNTDNTIDIINPNGPTATVNLKAPLTLSQMSNNATFTSYNTGTGGGPGIWGESPSGAGVIGKSSSWVGTYGETSTWFGVWGKATGSNGKGVFGESATSYGVWGKSPSGAGVVGESENWIGVYGQSNAQTGVSGKGETGVYGESITGAGVVGYNSEKGVFGELGFNKYAVYASANNNIYNWAGFFEGDVHINGEFSVTGSKDFEIDHPLDPENKYLIHSCVESSERMDIYNGNIITDGSGSATVELPGYFEALNVEYRYQLTTIGQPAQVWIEKKIQNNRFEIRSDKPNVEISWQVTGIRNDEYAKQHPFVVEQEKEQKDKGKYLMPELFGQPKEMGIHFVKVEKPKFNQQQLNENQKANKNDNK